MSEMKAFADDKLDVTQKIKLVFHRLQKLVGDKNGKLMLLTSTFCVSKMLPKDFFLPQGRQKSSFRGHLG